MKGTAHIHVFALLAALVAAGPSVMAQSDATDTAALRASLERRYDVLPLRDGVALRPKDPASRIRSIELTGGAIAIDGQPMTGAELRDRLGDDADLVLRLSYLSSEERRAAFGAPGEGRSTPPADVNEQRRGLRARRLRGHDGNDRIRFGGSIVVREDEIVDGDVVAIGGAVRIDGEVHGDAVAIGGPMTLGPHASVSDNVVAVGGGLSRDPGAHIGGKVQEIGIGSMDVANWRWSSAPAWLWWGSMMGSVFALVGTLTRLAILCLLSALVLLLGREYAERAGGRALHDPVKAGAIGVLAALLFLPVLIVTAVVLVITIVGIPLLLLIPFLVLGLAVVGLIGFTGVSHQIGRATATRMGWATDNPYTTTIIGILLVTSPILLARLIGLGGGIALPFTLGLGLLGSLLEFLVWAVGFGAVALVRFNRPSDAVPAGA